MESPEFKQLWSVVHPWLRRLMLVFLSLSALFFNGPLPWIRWTFIFVMFELIIYRADGNRVLLQQLLDSELKRAKI